MNRKVIADYIVSYSTKRGYAPTESKELNRWCVGICWNTKYYYFDAEVIDSTVEFTLSGDRKHMELITIAVNHPHSDIDLHSILDKIFTRIEETI